MELVVGLLVFGIAIGIVRMIVRMIVLVSVRLSVRSHGRQAHQTGALCWYCELGCSIACIAVGPTYPRPAAPSLVLLLSIPISMPCLAITN